MSPGAPMTWWRGVSPQGKLVTGLAAVFGLLVGVAALAWVMLMENQRSEEVLYEQNFHNVIDLANLRSNLNAEALAVAMMLDRRREHGRPWQDEFQSRRRANDEILARLRTRLGSDPAIRAELDALTKLQADFVSNLATGVIPMLEDGQLTDGRRNFGRALALHSRTRALARGLEAIEAAEAYRLVADGRHRARLYATVFTAAGGVAVTGAAILIFLTHRLIAGHLRRRRRTETELRQANRALRTVNACNQALVRTTSELELLQQVCQAIVTEGGYRLAWVGWAEHDKNKSVRPVAQAGCEEGYLEQAQITWADTERGRGPTGTAIRTGRAATCRDMRNDPDFAPWRAEALGRGQASSIALPLQADNTTIGALSIYSGEPGAFDAEEERLLGALANDLVYGVMALRAQEDRLRFKRALSSASMYNRRLIEASLDPLVAIGPDGKITDANAAAESVTGRSRQELVGTDFCDYFTDRERARAAHRQAFRQGPVRDYPLEMRHRDGRLTAVVYNASVYRDDDGKVAGVFAAARDVSERRLAEEEIHRLNRDLERRVADRTAELAASERRFHSLYDTAPVSIWQEDWSEVIEMIAPLPAQGVTDFGVWFGAHPDFVRRALAAVKILDVNAWTLEMFGARDKGEMLASLDTVFSTPETLPGFVGELIALARGDHTYRTEIAANRVDGSVIHGLMVMTFPAPGTGGQVLVTVTDITARKSAEAALRRSEEQFRRLFDTTPQGVVYQDAAGTIISMNPAAVRILGKTPKEFLGSSSVGEEHSTIREDGSPFPGLEHPAMVALQTGRQVANVIMGVYNPREKVRRWINIQAVPLFRPGAKAPYQVYTVFEDITERKQSEDRIRRLNEELQLRAGQLAVANKELEAFAYSVSHDLRAPLRSIDGFSRILREEQRDRLDEGGRDALRRVGAAAQRMDRLIDDLLMLSRITRSEIRLQKVDLSRLAQEVVRELRQAEPDRVVECEITPGLTARADQSLMRVALQNLLGNAWKFTAGRAPASIEFGATERSGLPVFFVRDNGSGFDMAYAGKLFGAFQRLHKTDEFPGTGIGLATVQRVLHRHGGRIWAEAAPGKGATFFFALPA